MGNLTATKVKAIKEPGRYSDGRGLLLVVRGSGAKSWILRVQVSGRRHDIGLGSETDVSLSAARERAVETRKAIREGVDPKTLWKNSGRIQGASVTFETLATEFHDKHKENWRNAKHREQWISTLREYAFPKIGRKPVDAVASRDIIEVVSPIWHSKPETGRRVLQRILAVLNFAHAMEYRDHEAPARSVRAGLGKQRAKPTHFASVPYAEMPELMARLMAKDTTGSLALQFLVLTAARSGEVRHAVWSEIDLEKALWTVPADRMKARVEHQVPLSPEAVAILQRALQLRERKDGLVFPSSRGGALSDMTLLKAIRSVSEGSATVHGCRSSFRDWAAERTSYPAAAAEAALAHTIINKAEAAYHRTNYLDARRAMMTDWAAFLSASKDVQLAS